MGIFAPPYCQEEESTWQWRWNQNYTTVLKNCMDQQSIKSVRWQLNEIHTEVVQQISIAAAQLNPYSGGSTNLYIGSCDYWWLQHRVTFSRSFFSGLSWDDLWENPCVGCSHVMGVRQTLDWVVMTCGLLSTPLDWVEMTWDGLLPCTPLDWVESTWDGLLTFTPMDLVESAWYGSPNGTPMDLVELIYWEWRPCGWAQVDVSLVVEH